MNTPQSTITSDVELLAPDSAVDTPPNGEEDLVLYECDKCKQVFPGEPWLTQPPTYTSPDGLGSAYCRGCTEINWPDPVLAYDEEQS